MILILFVCCLNSTTKLRTVQEWRDDSLCFSNANGSDSSTATSSSSDKLRSRKSYVWQVRLIIFHWKSLILFLRSIKKCARLMTNLFRKRLGWVRQTPMESSLLLFVSTPMTWKLSLFIFCFLDVFDFSIFIYFTTWCTRSLWEYPALFQKRFNTKIKCASAYSLNRFSRPSPMIDTLIQGPWIFKSSLKTIGVGGKKIWCPDCFTLCANRTKKRHECEVNVEIANEWENKR